MPSINSLYIIGIKNLGKVQQMLAKSIDERNVLTILNKNESEA